MKQKNETQPRRKIKKQVPIEIYEDVWRRFKTKLAAKEEKTTVHDMIGMLVTLYTEDGWNA